MAMPTIPYSSTPMASNASFTVPVPAGAKVGDWLFLYQQQIKTSTWPAAPAGWVTLSPNGWGGNGTLSWSLWIRKMVAGDTSATIVNGATVWSLGIMLAVPGAQDTPLPVLVKGTTITSGVTVTGGPASVTPPNQIAITIAGVQNQAGFTGGVPNTDIVGSTPLLQAGAGSSWATVGAQELPASVSKTYNANGGTVETALIFQVAVPMYAGPWIDQVHPGDKFTGYPTITASDDANAAKLGPLGFKPASTNAWLAGEYFTVNGFAFYWAGTAWAPGTPTDTGQIAATCEVWIDGIRFPDGSTNWPPTEDPVAVNQLSVTWGRQTPLDQPVPASCSFVVMERDPGGGRYDDRIKIGAKLVVYSQLGGTRIVVFNGRISDLNVAWDDSLGGARIEVTADDLAAELAARYVGAEPWPAEQLNTRARRILTAAGLNQGLLVGIPGNYQVSVSRMDVDRQAAWSLLTEVATSGSYVIWGRAGTAGAAELYMEWLPNRVALSTFTYNAGTGKWAPAASGSAKAHHVNACDVLRDPVHWHRDVTDLITRVVVRWQDQSTSPGTTERSVTVVDAAAENTWGSRGVSVGSILTTSADATTLANRVAASNNADDSWAATGLELDLRDVQHDDPATRALVLAALNTNFRGGTPLMIDDLPFWTPAGGSNSMYLEGGKYTFEAGFWILELVPMSATGIGQTMTYGQTPTSVKFVDVEDGVSYTDMIGVAPPA